MAGVPGCAAIIATKEKVLLPPLARWFPRHGTGTGGIAGLQGPRGQAPAVIEGVPGQFLTDRREAPCRHGKAGHAHSGKYCCQQRVGGGLAADAYWLAGQAGRRDAVRDELQEGGLPGVEEVAKLPALAVRGQRVLTQVIGADA